MLLSTTWLMGAPSAYCGLLDFLAVLVDSKEKEIGRVPGRIGTIPAGGTTQFQFSGRAPAFALALAVRLYSHL